MDKELPLHSFWEKKGARFEAENGWLIPSGFSKTEEEYWGVRKNAGLIDFSHRGKIKLSGKDRVTFLHNILTNDIQKLRPGQGCHAALLSAPGKVLADMRVYLFSDHILLITEAGLEKKLMLLFEKYLIMDDVEITDVSDAFIYLALEGPHAQSLLDKFGIPSLAQKYDHANIGIPGLEITFLKDTHSGENGFHILIPKDKGTALIETLLGQIKNMTPVGNKAAEILRIEAGYLRYGIDMDEEVTLSETGLDESIADEKKGCYPGQEVVARTKTYSGLHKKLTALKIDGPQIFERKSSVYDAEGKEKIGWITSCGYSPKIKSLISLAYILKTHWKNETIVSVENGSEKILAVVKSVPIIALFL